jgi:hypothetical protein
MGDKRGSSEAAWALITEGVTAARLEAHRLRHLMNRGLKVVNESEHRDHLYQMAGDVLVGGPNRMTALEIALDRTALALSKMGEDYLKSRLPIDDKTLVEEAIEPAGGFKKSRAERLARRWVRRRYAARGRVDPSITDDDLMAWGLL